MRKINFLNIILVLLISLSLFLTGSLWFDNYRELSLVMAELPFWFNETFDFDKVEAKEFVKPFKVTLTNGDSGNYSYYAFSEGNEKGFELIKEIINKIPANVVLEKAFINEWNELPKRKSVICEFGEGIDCNVIKSIIPSQALYNSEISNISAIAVTKSVNGVMIYVKELNDNIYRCSFNSDSPEFIEFLEGYSDKTTYAKFVKLEEMGTTTFYGNKKILSEPKVLFPVSAKQSNRKKVSTLDKKVFHVNNDLDAIEKIVSNFFKTYEHTQFTTTDNNYIFLKDNGSTVKIFNDGVFEYVSKENTEFVESNVNTALDISLEHINYIHNADNLYLLYVGKNENCYEFKYGLNMEEIPVINTKNKVTEDNRVVIHIKVENNKVIYYRELLDRYESKKTDSYLSSFGHNILDDVLKNIERDTTVTIDSLDLVYDVTDNNKVPCWFTNYSNESKNEAVSTVAAKIRKY